MNIFKRIQIPNGETVSLDAHDTWSVRWWSMGRVSGDGIPERIIRVEVFPSQDSANRFAHELKEAAKLLQDYNGLYGKWGPFIEKNTYKGR